jgi:hypothetical protein
VSDLLTDFLAGVQDDLEHHPERPLKDPDRRRREAEAWERLLVGLTVGHMYLPDDEALRVLQDATEGYDKDNEWEELSSQHNALHALLALVNPSPPPSGEAA